MIAAIIGVTVITAIPIVLYVWNFLGMPLSKNPTDWGVLGDYVGGILNPLLSLVNIIVLIYITTLVSKVENKRLINEFRHSAYLDLTQNLEIEKKTLSEESLSKLYSYLNSYCFNNLFLFEGELNLPFQNLMGSLSSSVSTLERHFKVYHNANEAPKTHILEIIAEVQIKAMGVKELEHEWQKFRYNKQNLLGFIQRVMIGGDIKPYLGDLDAEKFVTEVNERIAARKKKEGA